MGNQTTEITTGQTAGMHNYVPVVGSVSLTIQELDALRAQIVLEKRKNAELQSTIGDLVSKQMLIRAEVDYRHTMVTRDSYEEYNHRYQQNVLKYKDVRKEIVFQNVSYMKLNEVQIELKEKAEANVNDKLVNYDKEVTRLNTKYTELVQKYNADSVKHQKEILDLKEAHAENVLTVRRPYTKIIAEMQDKIELLESDELRLFKDNEIRRLVVENNNLKTRPIETWWKSLW